MATDLDSTLVFFTKATPAQWSYIFSQYKEVLKTKAARRLKKGGPDELIRMDAWYQEEFPRIIHSRKEPHITHEELIQLTKWKLMRGKYRPNLIDLVRINTETAVIQHSKKAFKRLPNLSGAMAALTCLKGVGPATASAILAAAFPEQAPFMADESMISTPGVETMDYTVAEYLNYTMQLKKRSDYLNKLDPSGKWDPHKIEMALWAHFVASQLKPSILTNLPPPEELPKTSNGKDSETAVEDSSTDSLREGTRPAETEWNSSQEEENEDTRDSSRSLTIDTLGDNKDLYSESVIHDEDESSSCETRKDGKGYDDDVDPATKKPRRI